MFRKVLLSVGCMAALTISAQAADMATKAPRYAPIAQYNWTGFYIGVNGGGAWNDASGGFAGGQIGVNWQMPNSPLVLGIEGDLDWTNADNSATGAGVTVDVDAKYIASARGRIGYAFGRVMPYVTAGWAWSKADVDVTGLVVGSSNFTADGWALGGGVEWAFAGPWSLKAEYVHYGLESDSFTVAGAGIPSFDIDIDTVKVGLNYRFGGF
jgi:outer membrane immunogenic protein